MNIKEAVAERKNIIIRLIFTVLFLIVFEIIKLILHLTVFCQFVYSLVTQSHNKVLMKFSNKLSTYAYRILRYVTLNENEMPFPFNEFPHDVEPDNDDVKF